MSNNDVVVKEIKKLRTVMRRIEILLMKNQQEVFTRAEAARFCKISQRVLDRLTAEKKIACTKSNGNSGRVLYTKRQLMNYLESSNSETLGV